MALHLPILDRCNIGCVFCSAYGRGGQFSMEYLLGEIEQDKTGHVQISGGDPFLKPPLELLRILKFCKEKGKLVEFQTNAAMVPGLPPKFLTAVMAMVDYFNVNHSAPDPELDRKVTGLEGVFEQRLAGIRELLGRGATVRLTYIVHRTNLEAISRTVEQVRRDLPGVAWIQFSYVKAMGKAQDNARLVPRYEEAAPFLNEGMRRARELGLEFMVDHIPVCFVRDFKDRHADYQKMIQGRPGVYLVEKQQVAACESCSLKPHCPGPRVDYLDIYEAIQPPA